MVEQQDKLEILTIRQTGRNEKNLVKSIELYNKYNPNNKVRKKWCGGCTERVFTWINTIEI